MDTAITIIPTDDNNGTHRTGYLSSSLTEADITTALGFPPNIDDDASKVTASWAFIVDGELCAVWDYKGARWSTFGSPDALRKVFGAAVR